VSFAATRFWRKKGCGMKGRKPKPTALKLLTGNPGKRRLPKGEPKPKRVIPAPPEHMTARALTAWGSLATRLDRLGLLTELDALALEQLCENYGEILELRADVADGGRWQVVVTKQGGEMERARPCAMMLADAERRFRGMMCEFGLTPSARSRVTASGDDERDRDPAEAYFG
jgi:P27 family predicted phage terminase small subunit